eukprot:15482818-Alexandrium_andersonii.AAC.3
MTDPVPREPDVRLHGVATEVFAQACVQSIERLEQAEATEASWTCAACAFQPGLKQILRAEAGGHAGQATPLEPLLLAPLVAAVAQLVQRALVPTAPHAGAQRADVCEATAGNTGSTLPCCIVERTPAADDARDSARMGAP